MGGEARAVWGRAPGYLIHGRVEGGDAALGKAQRRHASTVDARVFGQGDERAIGVGDHGRLADLALILDRALDAARSETVHGEDGVAGGREALGIGPVLSALAERLMQHDDGRPGRLRRGGQEAAFDRAGRRVAEAIQKGRVAAGECAAVADAGAGRKRQRRDDWQG